MGTESRWNDYHGYKMCPCKDCELRHLRCHASCGLYADWRKSVDAQHAVEVGQAKALAEYKSIVGSHADNTTCVSGVLPPRRRRK